MARNKEIDEDLEEADEIEEGDEPEELREISRLEEEILNNTRIDFSELQNFISRESSAPVLDQVAVAPRVIGLGHGSFSDELPTPLPEDNSDPFKYSIGKNEDDPTKYVSSDAQLRWSPTRTDSSTIGRENPFDPNRIMPQNQSAFFTSTHQKVNGQESIEKYVMPENQNIDTAGRHDPFKMPEVKYDPKLPKH